MIYINTKQVLTTWLRLPLFVLWHPLACSQSLVLTEPCHKTLICEGIWTSWCLSLMVPRSDGRTRQGSGLGPWHREFLITNLLEPCSLLLHPKVVNHKKTEAGVAVTSPLLLSYCCLLSFLFFQTCLIPGLDTCLTYSMSTGKVARTRTTV